MRTMTSTERAYVAGIVDGEGWIEFKRKPMKRNNRPGKPTHNVLIIRMEVPQVDGRLIDYMMKTTGEGNRDLNEISQSSYVSKINIVGARVITVFTDCSSRSIRF